MSLNTHQCEHAHTLASLKDQVCDKFQSEAEI